MRDNPCPAWGRGPLGRPRAVRLRSSPPTKTLGKHHSRHWLATTGSCFRRTLAVLVVRSSCSCELGPDLASFPARLHGRSVGRTGCTRVRQRCNISGGGGCDQRFVELGGPLSAVLDPRCRHPTIEVAPTPQPSTVRLGQEFDRRSKNGPTDEAKLLLPRSSYHCHARRHSSNTAVD